MVSRSCCYNCHIFMQEDSIMSAMVAVEDPRVSAFHAQLKSVMGKLLEQLLNNAVTEITQVYVDTSVVATMEEEDGSSPRHKSSPSCKTPSPAPDDPASPPPPPPHSAISPDVPLKAEGLVSEPHPPVQHPTIVHVTSLARRDAYTQTGSSSLESQHPKSAAPMKKELLEVLIGASPIDQDQAEVPVEQLNQPAAADHPEKLTSELRPEKCCREDLPQAELGGPSSTLSEAPEWKVPNENGADGRQADNMEEEDGPPSASKQGNADTDDQDQVVSREDSQQRVAATQPGTFEPLVLRARSVHRVAATRPEIREQLVLRARSVPRRPGYIPKKKSGCNPHRNGTEMNPDETSQVSQMSCLASASVTQASSEPSVASEPSGDSSNLEVCQWNVPFKDVSDEEQPPDNVEEDDELPGPSSALKEESADADRTSEELAAKRLKSCVIELVKVNPLTCHFCRKTFMLRRALRRHLRLHTGEKPHACKRCDRSFALKSNLKKHHDTVHGGGEGSPPFCCEQCTKQFCSKSKLSVHVRVHTGERPHRCIFCRRKRYRLKKNLVKHMLKHLGYAPRNMAVA